MSAAMMFRMKNSPTPMVELAAFATGVPPAIL
jgi:hypothetical protein